MRTYCDGCSVSHFLTRFCYARTLNYPSSAGGGRSLLTTTHTAPPQCAGEFGAENFRRLPRSYFLFLIKEPRPGGGYRHRLREKDREGSVESDKRYSMMCGRQGPNKIKGIKNKTHFAALEEKSSGEVHKTCVMQQDILSKTRRQSIKIHNI